MKTTHHRIATFFLGLLLGMPIHSALALTVSESSSGDFANDEASAATYDLDVGGNDVIGSLTPQGDADFFKVRVLPQRKVTLIQRTGSAGVAPPVPLYAGTYTFVTQGFVLPGSEAWSFTFLVESAPDYEITTTSGQVILRDRSNLNDTLTLSEPFAGTIRFAAPGRTFSVDGGLPNLGNSGSFIPLGDLLNPTTLVVVHAGSGHGTINVGDFPNTSFPNLTINGGTGDDTVNFTGALTLADGSSLDVDLQNDDPNPGVDSVNVAAGANINTGSAFSSGKITVKCSRSVHVAAGGGMHTRNGDLTVEANQQATPTEGDFIGVEVSGGTLFTNDSTVVVRGRGGNAAAGGQLGVLVAGGGKIAGSAFNGTTVQVTGTGGAGGGQVNRGLTIADASSLIEGSSVTVTGQGGGIPASDFNVGIALLGGGGISAKQQLTISGTGGQGGFFNQGVEMGGATITKQGAFGLNVTAVAGSGDSVGLFMANGAAITGTNGIWNIATDSISLDGTSNISAPFNLTFSPSTPGTKTDLGGADDTFGTPKTLGITDAELDQILSGGSLVIGGSGPLTISSGISRTAAQNLLLTGSSILASFAGVDVSHGGVITLNGPLSMPITGAAADTGYPQLKVVGGVNLNNVPLSLIGTTFAGAAGDVFTLVDNDGTDAISGSFSGFPEGTSIAWPGITPGLNARISYTGGDGNDATLTLFSTLTVTNTADSGLGSLRDTITYAANNPGADTITFAPALSGQSIALNGVADFVFGNTALTVNDSGGVTLDASALPGGLTLTDTGTPSPGYRAFRVISGSSLTLRGLTLSGFSAQTGSAGGAIFNYGTLALAHCTLSGNSANSSGGAIFNDGPLTLAHCTLSGNSNSGDGGAISNFSPLTLTHCTLSDNSASGDGGAILNYNPLTLTHCTLSGNSASGVGGAILNFNTLTLTNTLVGGNTAGTGQDIRHDGSTLTRQGANIVQTAIAGGGSVTGTGTIAQVAPLLAPLGNYGGPTQTMALQPGSPARNTSSGSSATNDQRGFPIVGTPDIGAYEAGTVAGNYNAYIWETLPAIATVPQHATAFDYDGDGVTNEGEWIMGSDPAGAVVGVGGVNSIVLTALNAVQLQASILNRRAGRTYRLHYSDNLSANSWQLVPGANPLYGTGSDHWTLNISGQDKRFYRVAVTKD